MRGLIGVQNLHRSLDQPFIDEKGIVGRGDHVHHRVANCEYIHPSPSHACLMAVPCRDGKPFLSGNKPVRPGHDHSARAFTLAFRFLHFLWRHGLHGRRARQ